MYKRLLLLAVWCVPALMRGAEVKIDSASFGAVEARAIGPAAMSGRISAMEGVAREPGTLYVGAAAGGIWKTTNGGTTFKPVFDRYTQSIGALAVDQANAKTVWAGTGESWVRNSVSAGTGVYRSNDAGESWQFMGLPKSERIGRIVIDPKNPNTVYVAVLGALWSSSEDRGLYKTADGGKTWEKILYVDANTGCADVQIDLEETHVVYAAMWQFRRTAWDFKSGGPGSGLHRSTDGGKTWEKVKAGLPEGELGRIALAVAPSRPSRVYAVVEAKKTAFFKSDDLGRTWEKMTEARAIADRPFYYSHLVPDPKEYNRIYKMSTLASFSTDAGKTWSILGSVAMEGMPFHPDHHALWINPQNTSEMYLGTDGGVYKSLDRGRTWNFLRNLPLSQFYHVSFDMERPYNVMGGLQDNGSWVGPSQAPGGITNAMWKSVGIGDGFYVFQHPADKNTIYSQYQGGKLLRFYKPTEEIKYIAPKPKAGDPELRFHWNAGVAMSPTNPHVLYVGSQFLYRSRDQGDSWERLSGDLTTNDPNKQKQNETGGLTLDNSSAENHCTIYSIAESPIDAQVLWVGTDDGNVHVSRDGGKSWKNVTANLAGAPKFGTVSSIEAGRFAPGVAYLTIDNHQAGDFSTYAFVTRDFGSTWQPLSTKALEGWAHVIREDRAKPELLFLGTEMGLYITLDGGQNWAQFTGNFPAKAPVRDLAIHPREHALIIGTHGRGLYIVDDITPIRQITPAVLEANFTVLASQPATLQVGGAAQTFTGADEFVGDNPREAAWITYYMRDRHMVGDFEIEILDEEKKLVTRVVPGKRRGINRVAWPMRLKPPKVPRAAGLESGSLFGPVAPEGQYTARIRKGEEVYTADIKVVADPRSPHQEADRKLQQKTTMALYRTLENLAYTTASVTEARDAARKLAEKVKDNETLEKSLKAYADKLDGFNRKLVITRDQGITIEQRLRERLGELYGEVSLYGGRPTAQQLESVTVLDREAADAAREADVLVGKDLEAINAQLSAGKLEPIKRLTREEFDKRP